MKNPKPFIAPGSACAVSEGEIQSRRERAKLMLEIGENTTEIDKNSGQENPYRVKAMLLIMQGLSVPESLKKEIEQYDFKTCK